MWAPRHHSLAWGHLGWELLPRTPFPLPEPPREGLLMVCVDRACFPCSPPREQGEGAGTATAALRWDAAHGGGWRQRGQSTQRQGRFLSVSVEFERSHLETACLRGGLKHSASWRQEITRLTSGDLCRPCSAALTDFKEEFRHRT